MRKWYSTEILLKFREPCHPNDVFSKWFRLVNMRWCHNCLIFMMGIDNLYIVTRPRCFYQNLCIPNLGTTLQWCHNEHHGISNHQPHDCLLNLLFRRRSKKTSKLHVTGLCEGNSPMTGEFRAQRASNTENVSIWWHHHAVYIHMESCLTHWGRVTHICVGNLTIIGSDNGLSPGRRQAIIWTKAGILFNLKHRNKLQWNL